MKAYWDDDVAILSAENIEFQVETAGLGSRFAAVMIDMTLQLCAAMVLLFGGAYLVAGLSADEFGKYVLSVLTALGWGLGFLIFYAYFFFFEWLWAGQTPGKRWLGLRVIHADGMPATWWPIFVRNLLRIVDFLPFLYGAGALIAVLNRHNQRIGDSVAGTVVARERRGSENNPVMGISEAIENFLNPNNILPGNQKPERIEEAPIAHAEAAPEVPLDPESAAIRTRLSQEDYELVRDFLSRRESLPEAARKRLAESLAMRLAAKLNRPAPLLHEREPLLEEVARAFGKK